MSMGQMRTWEDEQAAALRRRYPGWDIWFVAQLYGQGVWCARPKGHPVSTINTDSPENLIKEIGEAEASPAG